MKRFLVFILIFIGLSSLSLHAQQVYFCSSYSEEGVPKDASVNWNLGKNGGYIYILYSNKNRHIKSKTLIVTVLKQSKKDYSNYEKKVMPVRNNKNWAVLDYQFIEAGKYAVSVQDKNGKELARNYLTIHLKNRDTVTAKSYYNAITKFSKPGGMPKDTGAVFGTGEVNVLIMNDKPLKTDSIIIDVFKKGYETEKYSIYVTTKYLPISNEDKVIQFDLEFDQSGQYKISSYNRRSQKISEGFVTIR